MYLTHERRDSSVRSMINDVASAKDLGSDFSVSKQKSFDDFAFDDFDKKNLYCSYQYEKRDNVPLGYILLKK